MREITGSFAFNFGVMLFGVLIAALSQILLKKAALRVYDKWWRQYLNPTVVFAYAIFLLSSFCSVVALRVLPLSLMPIWNSAAYLFVALFAFLIMKERPGKRKLIGLGVILAGIALFSITF